MDNIRRLEAAVVFGLILALVIVSRLFIYSFRYIPLTGQTGGEEPLYALVGGAALAFSISTLPLLVLYLTVLFTSGRAPSELDRGQKVALLPAALFLLAFVVAFIITISGIPSSIAKGIYKEKGIIDVIGGFLVALCGAKVFIESGLIKRLHSIAVSIRGKGVLIEPPILGFLAGLLLFHHLDPHYDSVFFFTGRAGAFSHHPLSVGSFGLGLSAMYLGVAYSFSLMAASMRLAKASGWLKLIFGLLTLILGFSFATGTFSSVVEVIRWTSPLASGS
jgi:cytochrome c biogenesis protein CcdA